METKVSTTQLKTVDTALDFLVHKVDNVDFKVDIVNQSMLRVSSNVDTVSSELENLTKQFNEFVVQQARANTVAHSDSRLIQVRQDLESKFGHYDEVRRTTTGVLQADDLVLVRKQTIKNVTEELMITTPDYWLAPCLVALAAWIDDQKELAERAVKEGLRRNNKKTSLFWALVCRRAGRMDAAIQWLQYYLMFQDEENLARETLIVLDAYATGLLGVDSDHVIFKKINEWLDRLENKPGYIDRQVEWWYKAIKLSRHTYDPIHFPYLSKCSSTWPVLQDIMEGAELHRTVLACFESIFLQESNSGALKVELDKILTNLVSNYDEEEIPLRKEERLHQLIIDKNGDEKLARACMEIEESALTEQKDFLQLLSDASLKAGKTNVNPSTQKFAIALSKKWIMNAYNKIVSENRSKIPEEISIEFEDFVGRSSDGMNERDLISGFNKHIDMTKAKALEPLQMTDFEQLCLYGGAVLAAAGLIFVFFTSGILFQGTDIKPDYLGLLLSLIATGLGGHQLYTRFTKKKKIEAERESAQESFEAKRTKGIEIIQNALAEIVDFRTEFKNKDSQCSVVLDFLSEINPDHYLKANLDSSRNIKLSE